MNAFRALLMITSSVAVLSAPLLATEPPWIEVFDTAKKAAAKEHKDILMEFTGSDWCSYCKALKREVFDQSSFKENAPKSFILLELDYPQNKSRQSPEVVKQNEALRKDYPITGFPTVLLADESGRPYARTGYHPGGPDQYLKELDALRNNRVNRDAAWSKAKSASGINKAKLLGDGLSAIGTEMATTYYQPVLAEIKKLDPKNQSGALTPYLIADDFNLLKSKLKAARQSQPGSLRADVDHFFAAHPQMPAEQKQAALLELYQTYDPHDASDKRIALLEEIKALNPNSQLGQRAQSMIDRIKNPPPQRVMQVQPKRRQ